MEFSNKERYRESRVDRRVGRRVERPKEMPLERCIERHMERIVRTQRGTNIKGLRANTLVLKDPGISRRIRQRGGGSPL